MAKGDIKSEYFIKVQKLCRQYKKIFLVGVNNVGSSQMHQIRRSLRKHAVLLMGKNTMIAKAMGEVIGEVPELKNLFPHLKGNVGLVFTNDELKEVRNSIVENKVAAPAKLGAVIQCDVTIPAGNTGIAPDKTNFFQVLDIPTKVVKGAIEIANDVLIMKKGGRVNASQAKLLTMLNIMPFSYGCVIEKVYDNGSIFEPEILDIENEALYQSLADGIKNIAALSMAVNYPSMASVPYLFASGYKNVLSLSLGSEYPLAALESLKTASAAAAPAPSVSAASSAPSASAKEPVKEAESEEEEEMGFNLFD